MSVDKQDYHRASSKQCHFLDLHCIKNIHNLFFLDAVVLGGVITYIAGLLLVMAFTR